MEDFTWTQCLAIVSMLTVVFFLTYLVRVYWIGCLEKLNEWISEHETGAKWPVKKKKAKPKKAKALPRTNKKSSPHFRVKRY